MAKSAIPGPWAQYGPTGEVECHRHSEQGTRDEIGAKAWRIQKARILLAWQACGMARVDPACDGTGGCECRIRTGWTGGARVWQRLNCGPGSREGFADLSHVIARTASGPFCACNVYAESHETNEGAGASDRTGDVPDWWSHVDIMAAYVSIVVNGIPGVVNPCPRTRARRLGY